MGTNWEEVIDRASSISKWSTRDQLALTISRAKELVEERRVPGHLVEMGVGLGATALVLQQFTDKDRELHLYDTFEGAPEPDPIDIEISKGGLAKHEGKCKGTEQEVLLNLDFRPFLGEVKLVKGNVRDLKISDGEDRYLDNKIALAHLDLDLYKSTLSALKFLHLFMEHRGEIIVNVFWNTTRQAVLNYMKLNREKGEEWGRSIALEELPHIRRWIIKYK